MNRHPAMFLQNQTDGNLHCPNRTAKNPHTCWKYNASDNPPPGLLRLATLDPIPPLPRTPTVPLCNSKGAQHSHINNLLPGYVNSHAPLRNAQFFNLEAYAKNSKRDKECIPDLLTAAGTSTGWYTICCVVMQLWSILQTRTAYWANMHVVVSIDR